MKITIENKLILTGMAHAFKQTVAGRLTLDNPKYAEAVKMGRWTRGIPERLEFFECTYDGLIVPRGFGPQLVSMCHQHGEPFEFDDRRRELAEVSFTFHGSLKPFQDKAVEDMCKRDFGTLVAATGSGKTVMGLAIVAERRQPALIIIHTKELLNQWRDRIETFLKIPQDEIGIIGDGKFKIGENITVAMVQTLRKRVDEVLPYVGHVVVDECHRAPSRTFSEVITAFDSKYALGLSATPWRRDKLSKLIFWYIGDVLHEVNKSDLIENGDIMKPEVITRQTDFRPQHDPTSQYSKMLSELTQDQGRNGLIVSDVIEAQGPGISISLVLSERREHCEALQNLLKGHGIDAALLTGGTPKKQRQAVVDRLNGGKVQVLVATGPLIGEGFDLPALSTLFLATPIRFSGRVLQYIGRVLRPAPGKDRATIFDYHDVHVPQLMASARARQRVYEG